MRAVVFALGFVLGVAASLGCRPPSTPDGPEAPLDELRALVRAAELVVPPGRLACGALPAGRRPPCLVALDALEAAGRLGASVLRTAEACQQADAACLARATEEARQRLPELRRLLGREVPVALAPPAESTAPAGSAPGGER